MASKHTDLNQIKAPIWLQALLLLSTSKERNCTVQLDFLEPQSLLGADSYRISFKSEKQHWQTQKKTVFDLRISLLIFLTSKSTLFIFNAGCFTEAVTKRG
jgi:hypothetical protein